MAYILPEGQIDWIKGIATLTEDDLVFTWNVNQNNYKTNYTRTKYNRNSLKSSSSSVSEGR